jgi:NADPH2 dehydrogenase
MESISRCVLFILSVPSSSRLSCSTNPHADMGSPDPIPQFSYLVQQPQKYSNLAYLDVVESGVGGKVNVDAPPQSSNDSLRQIWCEEDNNAVFITAGGYTRQTAIETAEEKGGLVAFGRLFISNVSVLITHFCSLVWSRCAHAVVLCPCDPYPILRTHVLHFAA